MDRGQRCITAAGTQPIPQIHFHTPFWLVLRRGINTMEYMRVCLADAPNSGKTQAITEG